MKVVYQYINDHIANLTALGRVGLPTDISPVAAFLCTEEAYWVNAQRMRFRVGRRSGIANLYNPELTKSLVEMPGA